MQKPGGFYRRPPTLKKLEKSIAPVWGLCYIKNKEKHMDNEKYTDLYSSLVFAGRFEESRAVLDRWAAGRVFVEDEGEARKETSRNAICLPVRRDN